MNLRSKVLNSFIALLIAVAFMPVTGQFAFAEGEEPEANTPAPVAEEPAPADTEQPPASDTEQPPASDAEQPAAPDAEPPAPPKAAPAFDANGLVRGLKVKSTTYKSVKIGWTAYAKAAGYEVYRANRKNGSYKKIKTVTSCKYNDTGNKKMGTTKYYKVRAYATVDGKKKYSKYSSILGAGPKLSKPKKVTATCVTGGVKITWTGVTGAKKYQVYRATSKNGKYKKVKTTKAKSCTDTAVSAGTKYYYKVRAYRKVKKKKRYGGFSAKVEGMALLGNVGNLNVAVNGKTGVVTASWAAKKGAVGYQVQRALAGGKYATVATTKKLSVTDTLKASGTYVYRVRAYSVVGGKTQYGAYSATGGRANALAQAQSWVGCKESNGSHKKIIDVYNSYGPASGKIGYRTPWCAAFVSAVAIKTGNTAVIPVHSYCPSMLSLFAEKTYDKKYTPRGADVIFFDWNFNKVPDHVGMVEKTVGENVTTIEGNYSDAVKRRTFKKGYSLVLAYGLPNYTVRNTVSYTAPASQPVASEATVKAACLEITEALEPEPAETDTDAFAPAAPAAETDAAATEETDIVETPETDVTAAEETDAAEAEASGAAETVETAEPTEMETAEQIIDYIQEEVPAEEAGVSTGAEESEYNAFLVYEICDEMDIDACVVTVTEADGSESSYNEVVLDGELYILDASQDGGVLMEYTPEEIN